MYGGALLLVLKTSAFPHVKEGFYKVFRFKSLFFNLNICLALICGTNV